MTAKPHCSVQLSNRVYMPKQAEPSAPAMPVAIILLDNFSMMAFSAALDALVTANLVSSRPLYNVRTFGRQSKLVHSDLGIDIAVDEQLEGLEPTLYRAIIVCGGYRVSLAADTVLKKKLQAAARNKPVFGGIWNGAYHLINAGVLGNQRFTLHPDNRESLKERFPSANVVRAPYVIDEDFMSCAGPHSALPMMLQFIRREHGRECVQAVEDVLNRDRLDEEQDMFIASVTSRPGLPPALKTVLEIMENNIEDPVSLDELVGYASVSRRVLERAFMKHLGTSPSRFYQELRLTKARQLVMQSDEEMANIAVACGFSSLSHFRHCYRAYFGVPPGQARKERNLIYTS